MRSDANDKLGCMIQMAFFDVGQAEADEFLAMDVSGVTIRERFDRKMRRLIRRSSQDPFGVRKTKLTVRLLAGVIAILLLMAISVCAIPGVRQAIWNTVVEWYEDYIGITYQKDDGQDPAESPNEDDAENKPNRINEFKLPQLGDEYEVDETMKSKAFYMVDIYLEGELYCNYTQEPLYDREQWYNATGADVQVVNLYDCEYVILHYPNETNSYILWNDGTYVYNVCGDLTDAQLIEIATRTK